MWIAGWFCVAFVAVVSASSQEPELGSARVVFQVLIVQLCCDFCCLILQSNAAIKPTYIRNLINYVKKIEIRRLIMGILSSDSSLLWRQKL